MLVDGKLNCADGLLNSKELSMSSCVGAWWPKAAAVGSQTCGGFWGVGRAGKFGLMMGKIPGGGFVDRIICVD